MTMTTMHWTDDLEAPGYYVQYAADDLTKPIAYYITLPEGLETDEPDLWRLIQGRLAALGLLVSLAARHADPEPDPCV